MMSTGRNEQYLKHVSKFAEAVAISGSLIRLLPEKLKPFLAWLFVLPNRWHSYKSLQLLVPVIQERIEQLERAKMSNAVRPEAKDQISWYINEFADCPDPIEMTPKKIALRINAINFAAIHTSTFTGTNLLLLVSPWWFVEL
jgi:hypothetical protein